MGKRKRRIAWAVLAVVVACAVGVRIYVVNATAVTFPEEHHPMGEWVDLDGAFLSKKNTENTEGFSIRVNSARLMSYNDYIKEFGLDKTKVEEGFDTKSILNLEVEERIDARASGQIVFHLFGADLIPARKNNYLIFDRNLLQESEPTGDSIDNPLVFSPDGTYTENIPFKMNVGDTGAAHREPITDTSFEFIISNVPVRKIIDIQLDGE